jgi:23S rRNA (uracil1939-C5)-methyltransferase
MPVGAGPGGGRSAARAAQRVQRPRCPHFGLHAGACGGCKMQHLHPAAQVAVKQRSAGGQPAAPGQGQRPNAGDAPDPGPGLGLPLPRAPLGAPWVLKKGDGAGGLSTSASRATWPTCGQCAVLPERVSALLMPQLRLLLAALHARETAAADRTGLGERSEALVLALVLRHLVPLQPSDLDCLRRLRPGGTPCSGGCNPQGPDTVHRARSVRGPQPEPTRCRSTG